MTTINVYTVKVGHTTSYIIQGKGVLDNTYYYIDSYDGKIIGLVPDDIVQSIKAGNYKQTTLVI